MFNWNVCGRDAGLGVLGLRLRAITKSPLTKDRNMRFRPLVPFLPPPPPSSPLVCSISPLPPLLLFLSWICLRSLVIYYMKLFARSPSAGGIVLSNLSCRMNSLYCCNRSNPCYCVSVLLFALISLLLIFYSVPIVFS